MNNRNRYTIGILAALGMLVIILDGKTAQDSVWQGLTLCTQTVIPALFPFFILSGILSSTLLGNRSKLLNRIEQFCRLPQGSGSIMLIGFLSGYPVGAQLVTQAYREGNLGKYSAKRMLGFCSNAGPAFIFGMLSPLFEKTFVPWVLWGIHIAGALFVSKILPIYDEGTCRILTPVPCTLTKSLQNAIQLMATVCGWVILFRLLLGFCSRWFLWYLPDTAQILIAGLLELSNGCVQLSNLSLEGLRFILASILLSAGGLCVAMQTCSVTQELGASLYFPGKVLQTLFSAGFSYILQPLLFSSEQIVFLPTTILVLLLLVITFAILYFIFTKKVVAFRRRLLYNIGNYMH